MQWCLGPLFQRILFFYGNPCFLKMSQSPGQNQQNGKQCLKPPLSFKISLKDAFFHISINSLGLYLSPEGLLSFLTNLCGKNFQIYGIHIPRKCIESRHFYPCLSQLKTHPQVPVIIPQAEENYPFLQVTFSRKSVFPNSRNRWKKLGFALSEFNQRI